MVYLPVELPTGDMYGGHRPGAGLFGESIVAVDLQTGKPSGTISSFTTAYGTWIFPALRCWSISGGRQTVKALAQPTKQAYLYVFDRKTGKPIWPIEEKPVPQGDVPGEWYSPTQPIPTKPPAYGHQGVSIDDLIDFTPELRAEAIQVIKDSKYTIGPLFTPPVVSKPDGPMAALPRPECKAAPTGRAGRMTRKPTSFSFIQNNQPTQKPGETPSRRFRYGLRRRTRRGAAVCPFGTHGSCER